VLPVRDEPFCVRQVHVFLPAIRRDQYAFSVANDPEMRVVGGGRRRWQQDCRCGKRNDEKRSA
jgi:hypothetical protein